MEKSRNNDWAISLADVPSRYILSRDMLYRSSYRTKYWEMFNPTPTCNIADALDRQPQISDIVNNTTLGLIAADKQFVLQFSKKKDMMDNVK